MRKLLVSFVLLNCCSSIFAQDNIVDSLSRLLATEKQDTVRVRLMTQLGRAFLYSKPDTALIIAGQVLELSRNVSFKKGEILGLTLTGNVFINKGNYPKALEVFLQALKISE